MPYGGADPDGFLSRDAVVAYIEVRSYVTRSTLDSICRWTAPVRPPRASVRLSCARRQLDTAQ